MDRGSLSADVWGVLAVVTCIVHFKKIAFERTFCIRETTKEPHPKKRTKGLL